MNISHCRFPTANAKNMKCANFKNHSCEKCGHSIDLHRDIANSVDDSSFTTPPLAQVPQCPIETNVSTSEITTLESPTPNHNNFYL